MLFEAPAISEPPFPHQRGDIIRDQTQIVIVGMDNNFPKPTIREHRLQSLADDDRPEIYDALNRQVLFAFFVQMGMQGHIAAVRIVV